MIKVDKRKVVVAGKPKIVLHVFLIFKNITYGKTVAVFGIKIIRNKATAGLVVI